MCVLRDGSFGFFLLFSSKSTTGSQSDLFPPLGWKLRATIGLSLFDQAGAALTCPGCASPKFAAHRPCYIHFTFQHTSLDLHLHFALQGQSCFKATLWQSTQRPVR